MLLFSVFDVSLIGFMESRLSGFCICKQAVGTAILRQHISKAFIYRYFVIIEEQLEESGKKKGHIQQNHCEVICK